MKWEKKKVLVTVKAYPEKSSRYGDIVCTIGITEEGEWIRLYPIQYNTYIVKNIKKYDWIEVECEKAREKLGRKESYKIREGSIKIIDRNLSQGKVNGRANWDERNKLILPNLSRSIEDLNDCYKEDKTSIGLIKPKEVLEFYKKGELELYDKRKIYQQSLQGMKIPKAEDIPHLFGYKFKCAGCQADKLHEIQCEDWELLESYRKWGIRYGDINILWEKLHAQYFQEMKEKDLYFYMGMYSLFPSWLIVGLYYPPKVGASAKKAKSMSLSDYL